jgi:hypothetical protein
VQSCGGTKAGISPAEARFFLAVFLVEAPLDGAASGRDRFFAADEFDGERWEIHSAFADVRDLFPVMNDFGPRPLPAAMSSIERPEATEASLSRTVFFFPSRANASRCLINSQLVRFSPSRFRIRVRIQPPWSFSPSKVKSSLPLR